MERTEYFLADEFKEWMNDPVNADQYQGYISSLYNNFFVPNGWTKFASFSRMFARDKVKAIEYLQKMYDRCEESLMNPKAFKVAINENSLSQYKGILRRYIEFLKTK